MLTQEITTAFIIVCGAFFVAVFLFIAIIACIGRFSDFQIFKKSEIPRVFGSGFPLWRCSLK
jgi:hypothetical protein